jgi:hypothetical protein
MCCDGVRMVVSPEDAAESLLVETGLAASSTPPVDAEWIAIEHLDLDVQESDDLGAVPGVPALPARVTLSGLLLPAKRRIWLNALESGRSPGRRAFTIAHEVGHWQLHREDDEALFCRHDAVGSGKQHVRQGAAIEREANRFAAALLMPAAWLRQDVGDHGLNVLALADRYGVSTQAMHIRLEALKLLPDYLL